MLKQKIKIAFIHFIRKPIFILRFKLKLYKIPSSLRPNYFFNSNNFHSSDFHKTLLEIQSKEQIINDAELILQNKFQTLGSELTYLGEKINWYLDFKSSRTWEKSFYTKINSKESINKSDIKVPWELSRFHQAQYLAKAYLITQDEKYSKKFFELLNDWIESNPFCFGVNWTCAMEVAIRAVNWILALHIFNKSPHFTNEIQTKIYSSLYQHGLFIRNNLEYGRRNGNHYLSDLMGLIWLGAFFYNHSFGKEWFHFAQKELEKEILIQVYKDGVDYEKSTYYHRLVTEIFTLSFLVGEIMNQTFSEKYKDRLFKMYKFIASYVLDDDVPNIGDCDDGRIIKFNFSEKISEMRNTLNIGAVVFNDSDFKFKSEKLFVDALFLTGVQGIQKLKQIPSIIIKPEPKIFPEGGFYILEDSHFFLFFDAGDIGMNGWGGHGHNDTFSFELAYKNKRFIVDSGTYVYTPEPELRQKFRSTASHNTVMIDGIELADFMNLFRIKADLTNPKIEAINLGESTSNNIFISAIHHAYQRIRNPVIVKRQVNLNSLNKQILIQDYFYGEGKNKIEIFLHLHPDVKIITIGDEKEFTLFRDDTKLEIKFMPEDDCTIAIEDYYYSESYGRIKNNKRFRVELFFTGDKNKSFKTQIKAIQ